MTSAITLALGDHERAAMFVMGGMGALYPSQPRTSTKETTFGNLAQL